MSHTCTFNEALGVFVLRAKRSMDVHELKLAFDEVALHSGFKADLSLVVDLRGPPNVLTTDDIRHLATYVQRIDANWGHTKWSILVSSDVAYGLSRMFMAHTSDFEVTTNVFRTLVEADDWLGLGVEMDEILRLTPELALSAERETRG